MYRVRFDAGAALGLEVAPLRRDRQGLCRGLLVAGFARGPVATVAVGDEVVSVNGIPLGDFGSEAALAVLGADGAARKVAFRRRNRSGGADGDDYDDASSAASSARGSARPGLAAVFDASATRSRSGARPIDTYTATFGDGRVGMALLPAEEESEESIACGGLVIDGIDEGGAAPAGLRRGDILETLNGVPLVGLAFSDALHAFKSGRRRECRVTRAAAEPRSAGHRPSPSAAHASTDDTDGGGLAYDAVSPLSRSSKDQRSARRAAASAARRRRRTPPSHSRSRWAASPPDKGAAAGSSSSLGATADAMDARDASDPTTTGPSEPTTLPAPGDTPHAASARRQTTARRAAAANAAMHSPSDLSLDDAYAGATPRSIDGELRGAVRRAVRPPPPPPPRYGPRGWQASPHAAPGRVVGWHLVSRMLMDSLAASALARAEDPDSDYAYLAPSADATSSPRHRAPRMPPPRPGPRHVASSELDDYLDLVSTPGRFG